LVSQRAIITCVKSIDGVDHGLRGHPEAVAVSDQHANCCGLLLEPAALAEAKSPRLSKACSKNQALLAVSLLLT
jgi:hypothetical protein